MFENFPEWWEALVTLEKIYWGIAIPFTIFFAIQLLVTFIGGDIPEDGGADFDVETDDGVPFQFFTLKNLISFFTIFGWAGVACLDSGLSNTLSIIISLAAGLTMMFIMSSLFYFLGKITESGTLNLKNAIGGVGEVYMNIEGNRGNIGKIQIQVQGTLQTLEAITDDPDDLRTGAVVSVKEVVNNNLLVVTKSKIS